MSGIVALTSAQCLVEEGQQMHHCIGGGGFERRARAWQGYGYSIRAPESGERLATAWIVPSNQSPGAFYIEQIQGPHNRPVPFAVRHRVEHWLLQSTQARGLRLAGQTAEADLIAPPVHPSGCPPSPSRWPSGRPACGDGPTRAAPSCFRRGPPVSCHPVCCSPTMTFRFEWRASARSFLFGPPLSRLVPLRPRTF